MSDVETWGGEAVGEPTTGKASGLLALVLDGRKNGVAIFDPKNPWRGQALTTKEYATHGGRCPAPSICACQPIHD